MKVIIYLNGPIGSGKDTVGVIAEKLLKEAGIPVQLEQFKESLYELASLIASLPKDLFVKHATDRELKESPFFMLPKNFVDGTPSYGFYFSPRDWLIHVSERVAKPILGKGVFGKATAHRVVPFMSKTKGTSVVLVTDSGFEEEKVELDAAMREAFGDEYKSVLVHIARRGTDFSKDSRSYLANPDVTLYNDGTIEELDEVCMQLLQDVAGVLV
jgi:dephospho-CoA kinase